MTYRGCIICDAGQWTDCGIRSVLLELSGSLIVSTLIFIIRFIFLTGARWICGCTGPLPNARFAGGQRPELSPYNLVADLYAHLTQR